MQPLAAVCRWAGALIALVMLVGGCSAPVSDKASAFNSFMRSDQARAVAALHRVNAFAKLPTHIVVDPSDRLAAWSWTDGTVCVSRGFVRRLDNEELTAVVAHELGHLCLARDGAAGTIRFGFRGGGSQIVEQDADRIGAELLRQAGLTATSLQQALSVIRDAPTTLEETRNALDVRIDLLDRSD